MSNYVCNSAFTSDQEKELFFEFASSNPIVSKKARYKLILGNIGLVYSIIPKFLKNNNSFLEYDDLVSYGILGLNHAIEKFDVSLGGKFSTLAYYYINRYIMLSIDNASYSVNVEMHFREKIKKYKNECNRYVRINGVEPSLDEIVKITGYSIDDILLIKGLCCESISLSTEVFEDGTDMYDIISYIDDVPIQDAIEKNELCDFVVNALECLNENERKIICLSFGLCGYPSMGLEQIAASFGCSHQNIHRIKKNALIKLGKSRKLSLYYKDFN